MKQNFDPVRKVCREMNKEGFALLKEWVAENPPNMQRIKEELENNGCTKDELAELAIDAVGMCFGEYQDVHDPETEAVSVPTMYGDHLTDLLEILLIYGMDPNVCIDDENVMWEAQWIDTPDLGAKALRLLLEKGGNPNLLIPGESESLYEYAEFKISEDVYEESRE